MAAGYEPSGCSLVIQEVLFDTEFVLCLVPGYKVVPLPHSVSEVSFDTRVV